VRNHVLVEPREEVDRDQRAVCYLNEKTRKQTNENI